MKVGLFGPEKDRNALDLVFKSLEKNGLKLMEKTECLCETENLSGLDAILIQPHECSEDCGNNLKKTIEENPKIIFYIFAINHPERSEYFGRKNNLIYLTPGEVSKLNKNPFKYLKNKELLRK